MIEVYKNIYEKKVRFEKARINALNLYIVHQPERSLLIDTGLRKQECRDAIREMMEELGISYDQLDVFITHNHADHTGLAEELAEQGARIFMNPEEEEHGDLPHCYMSDRSLREEVFRTVGVTQENAPDVYDVMMKYSDEMYTKNLIKVGFPYTPLQAGGKLDCGEFHFKVKSLKGHTFGQIGLVDEEHKLLFSGDQLLTNVVPIVGSMHKDCSLLSYYFNSLEHIKHAYQGYLIMPGHGKLITDVEPVITWTVDSYIDKCDRMLHILRETDHDMTIREVGTQTYGRTTAVPPKEKFDSCTMIWAKTFSCLEYLYHVGLASRTEKDGTFYFRSK